MTFLYFHIAANRSGPTSVIFRIKSEMKWNESAVIPYSLPVHIRSLEKLSSFKRQLKSHFFQSAFTV